MNAPIVKSTAVATVGKGNASGGCPKCGLIGCSCDVEATFAASVCKKCKTDPCECAGKPMARTLGDNVCIVCRRARMNCICTSHQSVRQSYGDPHAIAASDLPKRPYSEAYIAMLKNEALVFYYHRDADGLVKWLDRVLR